MKIEPRFLRSKVGRRGECRLRTKEIFILVALCATFLGCSFHRVVSMPEDLIGVWKTAEKKYADRYFELNADRVIFSTGGWGVTAPPTLT